MPTFKKKPEIVDARQFTGGTQNGTDLVFWIESNAGHAIWQEETDRRLENIKVDSTQRYRYGYAYPGDWIMQNQDGSFKVIRQQDLDAEYDQV